MTLGGAAVPWANEGVKEGQTFAVLMRAVLRGMALSAAVQSMYPPAAAAVSAGSASGAVTLAIAANTTSARPLAAFDLLRL